MTHLGKFLHPTSTVECKYGDECTTYIRALKNSPEKDPIYDQCHASLFTHDGPKKSQGKQEGPFNIHGHPPGHSSSLAIAPVLTTASPHPFGHSVGYGGHSVLVPTGAGHKKYQKEHTHPAVTHPDEDAAMAMVQHHPPKKYKQHHQQAFTQMFGGQHGGAPMMGGGGNVMMKAVSFKQGVLPNGLHAQQATQQVTILTGGNSGGFTVPYPKHHSTPQPSPQPSPPEYPKSPSHSQLIPHGQEFEHATPMSSNSNLPKTDGAMNKELIEQYKAAAELRYADVVELEECRYKEKCNWYVQFRAYHYTHDGLSHFQRFRHPHIPCRHATGCTAYNRMQFNGKRMDDKCHNILYTHKPNAV
ncbi:MAG: hypothetical protein HRT90_00970 [Candidatus Margulisbacteria bacterium]|nr:hypothetical protein [Candidatus Margulisiibacteriota bacterium]